MPVTKYGCLIWVVHNYKQFVLISVVIAQAFLYTEVAVSKGICPPVWLTLFLDRKKEGLSPCLKVRSLTTCQEPNPMATALNGNCFMMKPGEILEFARFIATCFEF
jgi:hypothetical protein